eukprot:TRINITY_DN69_c0_g1_i1.p2 TRINITY_DN69_c0_g1~~TRINITY_DN69_c0_g1_i1.p2  ORF type:complete len:204 (-),score=32.11 TRINITY_DN69_c0_g1_i1:1051-1662(-)
MALRPRPSLFAPARQLLFLRTSTPRLRYSEDGPLGEPMPMPTTNRRRSIDADYYTKDGLKYDPVWGHPQPDELTTEYGEEMAYMDKGVPVMKHLRMKDYYDPGDVKRLYRLSIRSIYSSEGMPANIDERGGDYYVLRRAIDAMKDVTDEATLVMLLNNWRRKLFFNKQLVQYRLRNTMSRGGIEWERYMIMHPDHPQVFPHGV